jgi:Trypsin-like peptidase domain
MFRKAVSLAMGFTRPIVISCKTVAGTCAAGIGAYVVVNRDGWIVTADHIIAQMEAFTDSCNRVEQHMAKRKSIEDDDKLDVKTKRKQLSKLGFPGNDDIARCSPWWGADGLSLVDVARLPVIDLAVGRLEPFDPATVPAYPVFKNPGIDFSPGASLCRLGYPFYELQPSWDPTIQAFNLPPNSVPVPLFAIDGIYSREVEVRLPSGAPQPTYPLKYIETSTPGLKGQSGGPIVDSAGRIWGIQSQTRSYPLGFTPVVPGGKKGEQEHQFLNVGWGIHGKTLGGMMRDLGVSFDESTD